MKKALSLFLAILTVIGTVAFAVSPQSGLTAEAAEETFQEGSFIYKVADGNAELTRYTDWQFTGDLVIPETLGEYPVTSIGTNAFSSCNFYSVQLPSTLKNLAIDAFAWLGNSETVLSEIRISGSGYFKVVDNVLLSYAGDILYLYPRNAPETTYTVPNTVLGINYYAFFRVNNLKEITTPVSVQVIGDCAFEQSSIEKVTIGGSLKYLGNRAFADSELNEISLPNYVEYFGWDTLTATPFWNNEANYDEDGVLYHQNYLISTLNSEGKEYYEIKDGTRGIAGDAFYWSSLKEVFIPESVFFIGTNPFCSCKNLEKITVSEENGSFCSDESGSLFSKLKSVFICYPVGKRNTCYVIPEGVEKIQDYAFENAANLNNVYLPKTLKRTGFFPFGLGDYPSAITDIFYPYSAESWSYIDIAYEEGMDWACKTQTANIHYNSTSDDEHTVISDNGEERICSCGYSSVQTEKTEYTYTFTYMGVDYVETFRYGEEITLPEEIDLLAVTGWSGDEIPETMPCKNLKSTALTNQITKSDSFDVTAYHSEEAFDDDVTLNVSEITEDREPGGIYMVEGEYYKQVGLYNIKAVNTQLKVIQPNEGYKITIKLAIPDAYKNKTDFLIYHRFTDGGREQLSTEDGTLRVENGYLIFEVSSFSEFEIFVPNATAKIIQLPNKTTYYYNSGNLDLTGIKLRITNSDGSSKVITDTSLMTVKGFDSTKVGTQTVTVRYGQFSDTFEVKVEYSWWQWIIRIFLLGFFWY